VELNDLMGRSPRDSLSIAVPPPLVPPPVPSAVPAPWLSSPEIGVAQANLAAAVAAVDIAKADRRPQLSVTADVGWLPQLASNGGTGLNTGTGTGAELTLWFNWPVLDFGVFRARLAQAQLAARQSADSLTVVRRQSELEWSRAAAQLQDFTRVLQLRSQSVPIARDAYLQTEALYRGGVGTALDVIDAYAAWVDAQVAEADAELNVRQAEAHLIRWGTP
jgi:outer membrane protein TolC